MTAEEWRGNAMTTPTVVTADALELILRLNETTRDLLAGANKLREEMREIKVQTVKSPLLTLKEAAEYLKVSPQYLSQAMSKGVMGKGTPPPNCIEVYGPKGKGEKPKLLFEIAELDLWIARCSRRFSEESQERRWREYEAACA